jgi:hypothetical protein
MIAPLFLFVVGLLMTFHSGFRKWFCELEITKFAWGGLPLEKRMQFFKFVIGPGAILLGGFFLREMISLQQF